ncbi:hypothetical protein BUE93_20780 [Chromobacterium amazonense]|uniref:Uncharacterized protein n=1 Tax=Chromobacterium amazonense TaxID=1382803 RepID=A0A2S9WZ14_9NEIS|nr:hypothetical protein [Chromobacterium amazonense]PRP68703.1 hypothetical protein BUE93_20780 [Chromobacterium amazonense]
MADISDVLKQVSGLVAGFAYPNGTAQPSAAGAPIRTYPGWPTPNKLETDLKTGIVNVSLHDMPGERRVDESIGQPWTVTQRPAHTLTATVSGNMVTMGGAVSPQNVLIQLNGQDYIYTAQPSDTLNSIAAALSALVPGASSNGPAVTLPAGSRVVARVGGIGSAFREITRQEKHIMVSFWAGAPALRDSVASFLIPRLADVRNLLLPDGSFAFMRYERNQNNDAQQTGGLYRRDLFLSVRFSTTSTQQVAEVIAPVINVINAQSGQTIVTKQL